MPPEIGQLGNLQTLDLQWNKLSTLPPEIGQLGNLQKTGFKRKSTHCPACCHCPTR
ncbi:hypothetical protein ACFFOT_10530 [Cardiobacterium valvarum]|uniref:hypothetical protein n=1 Tax=Cardiobacterium valvarum TaxID=194702 RepID=UPI0035E50BA3